MAYKYNIKNFLQYMLDEHPDWKYIGLQGETAGVNIQGNPHKLDDVYFFGYNLIDSEHGRWNSLSAKEICGAFGIPWVPIVDEDYTLLSTVEEMKLSADGHCDIPNSSGLREGFVYRSQDGKQSFKNVSRAYLLKKGSSH
jgi:hypothetical protein